MPDTTVLPGGLKDGLHACRSVCKGRMHAHEGRRHRKRGARIPQCARKKRPMQRRPGSKAAGRRSDKKTATNRCRRRIRSAQEASRGRMPATHPACKKRRQETRRRFRLIHIYAETLCGTPRRVPHMHALSEPSKKGMGRRRARAFRFRVATSPHRRPAP